MIKQSIVYVVLSVLVISTNSSRAEDSASHHRTEESFQKSGYDYLWSVIQEEYDTRVFASATDQEQYKHLIDVLIRTGSVYSQPFQNSSFGLLDLYPELLILDADPPLYVQYRYHSSQAQNASESPDEDYLGHAQSLVMIAQRMSESHYPPYVVGATWIRAAEFFRDAGMEDAEIAVDAKEHGLKLLVTAASLDGVEPVYQEFVAIRLSNFGSPYTALTDQDKDLYCRLLKENPRSDPWIADFALGNLWSDRGWKARTSKLAKDVSDEQWELFYEYLETAHRHYTLAWRSHPSWPQPAAMLIRDTMGVQFHPDRDEAFWFNEAVSARIDMERAYTRYAYSLAPRWGGSIEEMYELMDSVVELSNEREYMGYILLKLMASITTELGDPHAVLLDEKYLRVVTRLMDDELKDPLQYKNKWQLRRALRTVAMGNFKTGKYQESARLLKAGGGMTDAITYAWGENNRFGRYASLLATPVSESIIAGLRAQDEGDSKAELRAFKDALKQIKTLATPINPEIIGNPLNKLESIVDRLDRPSSMFTSVGGMVKIVSVVALMMLFGVWLTLGVLRRNSNGV